MGDFDALGQLAEAGGALRMTELADVYELFVARLDDQELAALESALGKVTQNCTFG